MDAPVVPAQDDTVARRWLSVELLQKQPKRARTRAVLQGVVNFFLGFFAADEVFTRSRVVVRRRDTGEEVLAFDHTVLSEAVEHARSLESRLDSMSLFDFCRDVGIPFDTASSISPMS